MAKYYVKVNENGTYWYKDEEMTVRHRDGGPALEWADGTKSWWINGQRHREDGPAIEHASGDKYWYKNGLLHREDGPAQEFANGNVEYWLNDEHLTKAEWEDALRPAEEMTVAQIEQLLGKKIKIIK